MMAGGGDLVKKVMRFKLQLSDTAESVTVLQILQKLKDLDITLDILAETGIGKTVNCLRKHEQAGELAKSLVRCWKKLVSKKSISYTANGDASLSDAASGTFSSSEAHNRKRKKPDKEKLICHKYKQECENKRTSTSKKKKLNIKHGDEDRQCDPEEPSMSFECYLNYDLNAVKRKERPGEKNPSKKRRMLEKEPHKDSGLKTIKSPVTSVNIFSPNKKVKDSIMDLISIPLPDLVPECNKPSSVEYFERKIEKVSDLCDISEESAVFTGQRLNRKMQVYSGAKTIFLPTMMTLCQQCIRTLQNNINLLYETGGVPFELLEPVLERCTPGQLLRIEECNP
ncbi:hypothetical protein LDENG_00243030, partial [Lucifuga dentata]